MIGNQYSRHVSLRGHLPILIQFNHLRSNLEQNPILNEIKISITRHSLKLALKFTLATTVRATSSCLRFAPHHSDAAYSCNSHFPQRATPGVRAHALIRDNNTHVTRASINIFVGNLRASVNTN